MMEALSAMSAMDLFVGGFALLLLTAILGGLTHSILGGSGLGPVLNGCLVVCGFMLGAAARGATIGFQ